MRIDRQICRRETTKANWSDNRNFAARFEFSSEMFSPTRFVFLAGVFVFLTAVPAQCTEEFANPPRPFLVRIGEEIAANLVDLIFLFDRVAILRRENPGLPRTGFTSFVSILQRLSGVPTRQDRPSRTGAPIAARGDGRRQSDATFLYIVTHQLVLASQNPTPEELVPRYRS
jgi:hypothetical protein